MGLRDEADGHWVSVGRERASLDRADRGHVLSEYLGKKFDATFEAEAGGATAGALTTAERMNIPLIDGCPSGRCLPEVQMSSFNLNSGITRAPLAGVTRYGDVIIIPKLFDDYRAEDLAHDCRGQRRQFYGAANAVSGKVLKANLIPGSW